MVDPQKDLKRLPLCAPDPPPPEEQFEPLLEQQQPSRPQKGHAMEGEDFFHHCRISFKSVKSVFGLDDN